MVDDNGANFCGIIEVLGLISWLPKLQVAKCTSKMMSIELQPDLGAVSEKN